MTTEPTPRPRRSGVLFLLFTVVVGGLLVGYLVVRRDRGRPDTSGSDASGSAAVREAIGSDAWRAHLARIRSAPHVYYRSVRPGEYGHMVVASLDAPDEDRVVTEVTCDRLDFGTRLGICLVIADSPGAAPAFARLLDLDFNERGRIPLPGTPIRTRLSPDERFAAATVFVTGERYDADFTTRTVLIDMERLVSLGDLEQFSVERGGRPYSRIDFNFWGVTFGRDSRRFYATLGFTGTRLLIEGNSDTRHLRVVRERVECPALSPDERLVAFKSRQPDSGEWRPHILDLQSGAEWAVAGETRNIDDQVEWLNDGAVLYQYAASRGLPEEAVNVWNSPVARNASATPVRFIRAATSPAVVRP